MICSRGYKEGTITNPESQKYKKYYNFPKTAFHLFVVVLLLHLPDDAV